MYQTLGLTITWNVVKEQQDNDNENGIKEKEEEGGVFKNTCAVTIIERVYMYVHCRHADLVSIFKFSCYPNSGFRHASPQWQIFLCAMPCCSVMEDFDQRKFISAGFSELITVMADSWGSWLVMDWERTKMSIHSPENCAEDWMLLKFNFPPRSCLETKRILTNSLERLLLLIFCKSKSESDSSCGETNIHNNSFP